MFDQLIFLAFCIISSFLWDRFLLSSIYVVSGLCGWCNTLSHIWLMIFQYSNLNLMDFFLIHASSSTLFSTDFTARYCTWCDSYARIIYATFCNDTLTRNYRKKSILHLIWITRKIVCEMTYLFTQRGPSKCDTKWVNNTWEVTWEGSCRSWSLSWD